VEGSPSECYTDCCRGYFNWGDSPSSVFNSATLPISESESSDSNSWWSTTNSQSTISYSVWSTASTWWTTGSSLTSWFNNWSTWSTAWSASFDAREIERDIETRKERIENIQLENHIKNNNEENEEKKIIAKTFLSKQEHDQMD
jgi:hypothetical protein